MTPSQTYRAQALRIIRKYAPNDYPMCKAREQEADAIARNAAKVTLPADAIGMRRVGEGPLSTWLEAA
jgi:hypothetical protein